MYELKLQSFAGVLTEQGAPHSVVSGGGHCLEHALANCIAVAHCFVIEVDLSEAPVGI